jgi:hypothetical protein
VCDALYSPGHACSVLEKRDTTHSKPLARRHGSSGEARKKRDTKKTENLIKLNHLLQLNFSRLARLLKNMVGAAKSSGLMNVPF